MVKYRLNVPNVVENVGKNDEIKIAFGSKLIGTGDDKIQIGMATCSQGNHRGGEVNAYPHRGL